MNRKLPMPSLLSPRIRAAGAACALAAVATLACNPSRAGDELVDPTRPVSILPATAAVRHPGEVKVQAILERDGHRVAIVEGQVVRAGDRLPWGQVEEVTTSGIRYVSAGRTRLAVLEVPKLQVRRADSGQGRAP